VIDAALIVFAAELQIERSHPQVMQKGRVVGARPELLQWQIGSRAGDVHFISKIVRITPFIYCFAVPPNRSSNTGSDTSLSEVT